MSTTSPILLQTLIMSSGYIIALATIAFSTQGILTIGCMYIVYKMYKQSCKFLLANEEALRKQEQERANPWGATGWNTTS